MIGAMVGFPARGLVGLLVGGMLGSVFKVDWWEEVPLDRLPVGLSPNGEGSGVGLGLEF